MNIGSHSHTLHQVVGVACLLLKILHGHSAHAGNLVDNGLDLFAVLLDEGLKETVHDLSAVERDHPHEETEAEEAPVWDEPENEKEEGLSNFESANNHPVGKPVLVIVSTFGLDSANRRNTGVDHSVGGDCDLEAVEDDHEEGEDQEANSDEEASVDALGLSEIFEGSASIP